MNEKKDKEPVAKLEINFYAYDLSQYYKMRQLQRAILDIMETWDNDEDDKLLRDQVEAILKEKEKTIPSDHREPNNDSPLNAS